jgi:hypothetical protein
MGLLGLDRRGVFCGLEPKFQRCCPEGFFQPVAEKLVGQLLFPQRPSTERVELWVSSVLNTPWAVAWVGENRLTGYTAAALLHLLHHLARGIDFEYMEVDFPLSEQWRVNPAVRALLRRPQFRTRAEALRITATNLSFPAMREVGGLVVDYPEDRHIVAKTLPLDDALRLATEDSSPAKHITIGEYTDELVQVSGGCLLLFSIHRQ